MSDLVTKIRKLAKETHHSPDFMMLQYEIHYKFIEKEHESCYGMVASLNSKKPDYCMDCVGIRAYERLEAYYKLGDGCLK